MQHGPEYAIQLSKHIAEGTILRGRWEGFDSVCLLAALSPEVRASRAASACPAHICPYWWAELTVQIDDRGTMEAWDGFIRRYEALSYSWHRLSDTQWELLRTRSLLFGISQLHVNHPLWQASRNYQEVLSGIHAALEFGKYAEVGYLRRRLPLIWWNPTDFWYEIAHTEKATREKTYDVLIDGTLRLMERMLR